MEIGPRLAATLIIWAVSFAWAHVAVELFKNDEVIEVEDE